MENASKALIIAGAILIAILLIGIGVGLINALNDPMSAAEDNLSSTTKTMFNSKIEKYVGKQRGANVISLLSDIQTSNTTSSLGKTISVFKSGDSAATAIPALMSAVNRTKSYTVSITAYDSDGFVSTVTITGID